MAKKIQLQDANGNVLHPLTLGECVTMDNGENLDALMSKSQMFTPTITQDKSMFKVGTGADVDYSTNVKDGTYESLVFKGRSLVNLMTSCKDETLIQYHNPPADSNVANVSMIKPNTVYTIIYSVKYQEEGNTGHLIVRTQRDGGDINVSSGFTFGTTYKRFAYKFTTPSTIDYFVLRSNGHYFHVKEVMLLEGDYTNVDLPYFEGLCDSKMPILRNIGKNLFDLSRMNEKMFAGDGSPNIINLTDNSLTTTNNNDATSGYGYVITNLKKGVPYRLTVTNDSVSTGITNFNVSKRDGNSWHEQRIISIPIGNTASRIIYADNSTLNLSVNIMTNGANGQFTAVLKNIQIEEVSSENDLSTPYEDYKTNILRTSQEVVLREVNGVQDTYNALTGEYVKRIGECVLDGSQALSLDGSLVYLGLTDRPINNFGIADKMPVITVNQLVTGEFGICMQDRGASGRIYINIEGLTTREEILQHLRTNPITIHYGLVEPVTTIVKPSTMTPFAYQNGHVIVESGHEGQSLLPEIEYSVVTGRIGQVTQNTKVLRKQEQQIISLEELLLTQVVQMEYERTLLQFDYELQMMMLG